MPNRQTLAGVAALSLAACTPAPDAGSTPPPPATEPGCGADQLGGYVGRKATPEVIAALRAWRGDHPIRVLRPGDVVTMDYRADRLNLQLDANDVIVAVRCT